MNEQKICEEILQSFRVRIETYELENEMLQKVMKENTMKIHELENRMKFIKKTQKTLKGKKDENDN